MKKIILSLLLIITAITYSLAVPAKQTPITIKQPNGKSLTLILKGDEKLNWASTLDGYTLLRNEEGNFVYAHLNEEGILIASDILASNKEERDSDENSFLSTLPFNLEYTQKQVEKKSKSLKFGQASFPISGKQKMLVILVAFKDKAFTYTNEHFKNLCNEKGYSFNGATGSVRDYFYDSSRGKLELDIDVVGPVTLPYNSSFYSPDNMWSTFAMHTIDAADELVDFSKYDNNGDGSVDNVYIVFSGTPQSSTSNKDEIWPHAGQFPNTAYKDDKFFYKYSCSSEKRYVNSSNTPIDGVGTMCHEFGHILGLPDWYDTDYSGSGGQAVHISKWSLMSNGNYNNGSNTPPLLSGLERQIIGWDSPIILENTYENGYLPALYDSATSYRIELESNSEFFLLEHRNKRGWDSYIPGSGMIIYHGEQRKIDRWINYGYNNINVNPKDRGFFIEIASGKDGDNESDYAPFPGLSNNTYFTNTSSPKSTLKNGALTNKPITHIKYLNDSVITFKFKSDIPQAKTLDVLSSSITSKTATAQGSIVYMGSGEILEKGFYWYTNKDSIYSKGTKVIDTSNDTLINCYLTNLPVNTIVYYCAFAKNSYGEDFGSVGQFTTATGLGTITTNSASEIGNNQATISGNIVKVGDSDMIEKGFVFSSENISPSFDWEKVVHENTTDIGSYSCTINDLKEGVLYYYAAYITTELGTKFGSKRNFRTTYPPVLNNTISDNQKICGGNTPNKLIGSTAEGGLGNFTYLWQEKSQYGSWLEAKGDNNQKDYTPGILTDSTFYRRLVISNETIFDTSNTVLIDVINTWGGTIFTEKDTLYKDTLFTLTLRDYSGNIINWEVKEGESVWEELNNNTPTQEYSVSKNGVFTYRVMVQKEECPSTYSENKIITITDFVSLKDITRIEFSLYPNPNNGIFKITSSITTPCDISIINSLGKIVYEEKNISIEQKELNIKNIESGNYFLQIRNNNSVTTKSFIITK